MSKRVFTEVKFEVKQVDDDTWTDVSDYVKGWHTGAKVGELYTLILDVIDMPQAVQIDDRVRNASGGAKVSTNAEVLLGGVDVSDHTAGYDRKVKVGEAHVVRLYLQANEDIFRINGSTPWTHQ